MRRRTRPEGDDTPELNLAPFMNVVVILIPMLLLSVIFVQVGVLNVSTSLSVSKSSDKPPEEKPLELTVALSERGFEVVADEAPLEPVAGCDADGPTVCLADAGVEVGAKLDEAQQAFAAGDAARGGALLDEVVGAYDFRRLYNELTDLKDKHPDQTRIVLTGDPAIPYALLVRAMDVARFRLEKDEYADASAFWAANEAVRGGQYRELFSDPVLAVAQ